MPYAAPLFSHAHQALSDLGMVQSNAGSFRMWRARRAEWSVASFNTAERQVTWTNVNRTAKLMPDVAFGFIALRVLISLFRHHS